jgi:hypothetical protein
MAADDDYFASVIHESSHAVAIIWLGYRLSEIWGLNNFRSHAV